MTESELQAGDRVVVLASLIRGAALFAGAAAGGVTAWLGKPGVSSMALAILAGAVLGYLTGLLVSAAFCPVAQGSVVVIKVGPASLPQTLKAGLCASVPASVVVSLLCALAVGVGVFHGLWPALGAGIVMGTIFALLSSLT